MIKKKKQNRNVVLIAIEVNEWHLVTLSLKSIILITILPSKMPFPCEVLVAINLLAI